MVDWPMSRADVLDQEIREIRASADPSLNYRLSSLYRERANLMMPGIFAKLRQENTTKRVAPARGVLNVEESLEKTSSRPSFEKAGKILDNWLESLFSRK